MVHAVLIAWSPLSWMLQIPIPAAVAREVSNVEQLRLLINAAYMSGLSQVQTPLTKMIVMDTKGGDNARAVARALVSVGMPLSYVMSGGFAGWVAAELPVSERALYDTSTTAIIGDEVQLLTEKATAIVLNPGLSIPLVGGTVFGGFAIYNYHRTLEYIGLLGVILTIANKFSQYNSPREAVEDIYDNVQSVVNKVTRLVPRGRKTLAGSAAGATAAGSYALMDRDAGSNDGVMAGEGVNVETDEGDDAYNAGGNYGEDEGGASGADTSDASPTWATEEGNMRV